MMGIGSPHQAEFSLILMLILIRSLPAHSRSGFRRWTCERLPAVVIAVQFVEGMNLAVGLAEDDGSEATRVHSFASYCSGCLVTQLQFCSLFVSQTSLSYPFSLGEWLLFAHEIPIGACAFCLPVCWPDWMSCQPFGVNIHFGQVWQKRFVVLGRQ